MKVNRQLLCAGLTCLLLSSSWAAATAANGPNETFAIDSSKEAFGKEASGKEAFGIGPPFIAPLPQQPLILLDQLNDPTPKTHSTFGETQQGQSKIELMPGSALFLDPYAEPPVFCPRLAARDLVSCESE